jgi:hypothetical protein
MFLSSWLRNRTLDRRTSVRPSRGSVPCFRPRLEALDDRIVPSQVNLTVSSLADSGTGTLRDAILTADTGKLSDKFTINFSVTGTIDLQSSLPDLNNSIAIQGPGAGSLTIERSADAFFFGSLVNVDAGQTASLSGLTITHALGRGVVNAGTLSVANCSIVNNAGHNFSGGGGIVNDGTLTVTGSTFAGNSAPVGAGIDNDNGTVSISGSIFSNNSAGDAGGAVYDFGEGMTITGCTFTGNTAGLGGGIYNEDATPITIKSCIISGNSADIGGGICSISGTTISGCTLSGNSAEFGGGIFGNWLTVSGCTLSGNSAYEGGGLFCFHGATTVSNCTLSGNTATFGGGIFNDNPAAAGYDGTLTVRGSNFSGNAASDSGGGLYNAGTATLQECTLSGNPAGSNGGGIFNAASRVLSVKDSTVLGNTAPLGADLFNDHGSVTANDSTIGGWYNA